MMGRRRPSTMGDISGSNIPRVKKKSPVQVLEEARDRLMSSDADPSNYKLELRVAFRGGFAQCKSAFVATLNEMIAELQTKGQGDRSCSES